jgi:hypothetical protein
VSLSTGFCHLCGKPIAGQGKLLQHAKWSKDQNLRVCRDCLLHKPRCRICDLPMAEPSQNGLCVTCAQDIKICLTCGKRVKGRYWEIDGVGPYCDQCRRERPPCEVCGAPLGEERWLLSDGRVFCERCHASGIFQPQQAQVIYEESKNVIAHTLGLELNIPTALVLVDRNQLTEVIQKQSNGSNSLEVEKTMGIYARQGMKRGIYVQTGLPRLLFLQVASHEYAHAWQGENCPLLRDPLLHEGFAEWVAYRVLGHYGYKTQMDRMQAREDIYGQGLQFVLDLELKFGPVGVIDACRRSR